MPVTLPDTAATETLVIELTNKVRAREHLGGVRSETALAAAARAYARYLAKAHAFSHAADGKQATERAAAAGYASCQMAENLAMTENSDGFATAALAQETLEGWLNSPGHRANLLAPNVTDIGVAVARIDGQYPKFVIVQMLGRPMTLATNFQVSNATKATVTYTLSGASHKIEPGMGIRHTVCEPKALEFKSAGLSALTGRYTAEGGKVYTVTSKGGKLAVEVKTADSIR